MTWQNDWQDIKKHCVVERHIKLASAPAVSLERAVIQVHRINGVKDVHADHEGLWLDVFYDALIVRLEVITTILYSAGCTLDDGRLSHFRNRWYQAEDQTVRDGPVHTPSVRSTTTGARVIPFRRR